ncbi:MAG: hypothetical protein BGO55_02495 [Sphingobacteriales bacterium 50-39]|nr:MAG: hypothetical protein BGO55_02495 [Sphingobacteriales bacterium 50-39]
MLRVWFNPKCTHPRSTVYDGPSAGEPVVRLDLNDFYVNLFKCNSAAKKNQSPLDRVPLL